MMLLARTRSFLKLLFVALGVGALSLSLSACGEEPPDVDGGCAKLCAFFNDCSSEPYGPTCQSECSAEFAPTSESCQQSMVTLANCLGSNECSDMALYYCLEELEATDRSCAADFEGSSLGASNLELSEYRLNSAMD